MKLHLLHEATIQDIQNKIPILINKYYRNEQEKGLEIIQSLIELDPTHGKYIEWIIRNHKKGTIITPEDNDKIHNLLSKFVKVKGRLSNKDINNYSPGDLNKVMDELDPSSPSKRQLKLRGRSGELVIPDGAEHIMHGVDEHGDLGDIDDNEYDGEYDVIKINTSEASSILCSGTEWCTANKGWAEKYLKDGPFYLVYIDGKREYLIHYESNQFMDIYDRFVGPVLKYELVYLLEPVTGKSTENDPSLAYGYAKNIVEERFPEGEKAISKHPHYAYMYAENIIKARWPEGEKAISKDPESAYNYAKNIIKDRWPEGEKAINQDAMQSYYYARDVIKGRWLKGEEIIKENHESSYYYARDIIKDRWPKGEKAISKHSGYSRFYAENIIKGRWPEGEEAISKKSFDSYMYAKNIVKGRWPEGEEAINKSSHYASQYRDFLNK